MEGGARLIRLDLKTEKVAGNKIMKERDKCLYRVSKGECYYALMTIVFFSII